MMDKRVLTARTMLLSFGVAAAGMFFAASPAQAYAGGAQATILDDTYINMYEISDVKVQVDYDAGISGLKVRLVPGPTPCNTAATPNTDYQTLNFGGPVAAGGTHTFSFDIADASRPGAPFPEGQPVCAMVRVGYSDIYSLQVNYDTLVFSDNAPIKDTKVAAGTVSIVDPLSVGWLNKFESEGSPNQGDPAQPIVGTWKAATGSDATHAQVWWDNRTSPFAPLPAGGECGPFQAGQALWDFPSPAPDAAGVSYSADSAANGGLTPDEPLAKVCADLVGEGDEISFNAQWSDEAGNLSTTASTEPFPNGSLKVDRIVPASPSVNLLGKSVTWYAPLNSGTAIVTHDVVNLSNYRNMSVTAAWTATDIETIKVDVTDVPILGQVGLGGTTTLSQQKLPPATGSSLSFDNFDLTTLVDCGSSTDNPPTHTATPPLVSPTDRVDDCIHAFAQVIDFAGNTSAPSRDSGFKDTVRPTPPSLVWVPNLITNSNSQLAELEVTGETYTSVYVKAMDEDPSSSHLSNYIIDDNFDGVEDYPLCSVSRPVDCQNGLTSFRISPSGFAAIDADVTTLADGILTAESYLVDPYGNDSRSLNNNGQLIGFTSATATKNLTTPSLQLTAPAADSIHPANVTFTGIATYDNTPCATTALPTTDPAYRICKVTIYDHPSNKTNYGNPANIAIANANANASGQFQATYTYTSSAVKKTFFRASEFKYSIPGDPNSPLVLTNAPINGRPSAVRSFISDVKAPTLTYTSPGGKVYEAGTPVVIRGTANDDFSGMVGVHLDVYKLDAFALTTDIQNGRPPTGSKYQFYIRGDETNCSACPGGKSVTWSYDFSSVGPGAWTVKATAVDRAGNRYTAEDHNFVKLY